MQLHAKQAEFIFADPTKQVLQPHTFRGFVAGRGGGKTVTGAADLYIRAMWQPGPYQIVAPTYKMLNEASLPAFIDVSRNDITGFWASKNLTRLKSGSLIYFASAELPDNLRGTSRLGAWVDEGSIVSEEAYFNLLGCLRHKGRMGWLSCTFTPKGKGDWTFEQFGEPRANTLLIHCRSQDNPFLPPEFVENIRSRVPSSLARQELEGEFVSLSGSIMRPEWFRIQDEAPAKLAHACRAWDQAATVASKKTADPDYTAGVKLGFLDGVWYVLDVRRVRNTPAQNEGLIRQCADLDGKKAMIVLEEEGGSAGKGISDHYRRDVLPGYDFHSVKPQTSKLERAYPLAAAAEAGNVVLIRAPWNKDYLDELTSFPDVKHDDQVDATAYAMAAITERFTKRLFVC